MLTVGSSYYNWHKGDIEQITPYFSTREFTCHCKNVDCDIQKLSIDLLEKLVHVRQILELPIQINSGYRCHEYQLELVNSGKETAKGLSQHELGNAADVACNNMHALLTELSKEFNAIGTAISFIHVDTRPTHADGTKRLWSYSNA